MNCIFFCRKKNDQKAFQKKRLQNKLVVIKANYSNALNTLQVIRTLQNNLPNTKQNKKDILWCAAIEATMIEKINANGLVLQQKLQMQIDALKP